MTQPVPGQISILDYADAIKAALNDSSIDIERAVADESVRVFAGDVDFPPGFTPILTVPPNTHIAINASLRYRYREYAPMLALITAERNAGRGNIFNLLDAVRGLGNADALSDDKIVNLKPSEVHGHTMIIRPYMGNYMLIRRDMCIPFHHFVFQRLLRQRLSPDLDAVFEIGSGAGDALVELAMANPYPHIQFHGGDIAQIGHKCLAALGTAAGLSNLHAVDFDITKPDFGFLKGVRRVLVFSQFAMVYPLHFPEDFFDRLFAAVETVECILFEPLSFVLAKELSIKPLFREDMAAFFGISAQVWTCISRMRDAGEIIIDEIIPDIIGKTAFASVSLVRFRRTPPSAGQPSP